MGTNRTLTRVLLGFVVFTLMVSSVTVSTAAPPERLRGSLVVDGTVTVKSTSTFTGAITATGGVVGAVSGSTGSFTDLTSSGNTTLGNAAADTCIINAGPVTLPNATTEADGLTLGGDATIYRSGANAFTMEALTLTGILTASSTANVTGAATFASTLLTTGTLTANGSVTLGDAAADTLTVNAGPSNFVNATSAADGVVLGGDVTLYRSSANVLTIPEAVTITGTITGNVTGNVTGNQSGGTVSATTLSSTGNTTIGDTGADTVTVNAAPINLVNATSTADALIFGSSGTANLYHYTTDTLKTDDALNVAGALVAETSLSVGNGSTMTKLCAGEGTITSGNTTGTLTLTGAATGDFVIATINNDTTNACYIEYAIAGTNSASVKVNTDPGATGATIRMLAIRKP